MNKMKIGMSLLMVALVFGSAGFWWGKISDPQIPGRQDQLLPVGPSDTVATAEPNQYPLLHEIIAAVKAMREQVNTLNDRQVALGQQISTSSDRQVAMAQQINTMVDRQIALSDKYEALLADAQKTGAIQPGTAEPFGQQASLSEDNLPLTTPEGLQNWIEQQKAMQQMPEVQERRLMEKLQAVEWTDSLDPDSQPSDG
jgi:hypothetical protein